MMRRISVFAAALVAALMTSTAWTGPLVEVYKSPTCGYCSKWLGHLRANGFEVKAYDVSEFTQSRTRLGVPAMPRGSPGMEAEVKDSYEVLLFQPNGRHVVYQRYGAK